MKDLLKKCRFWKSNQRGFSLAETVTVITLIAILSAVSLSHFTGDSADVQCKNAARVLVNDLKYAQELAMTRGKAVRVEISAGDNLYCMKWDDDGSYLPKPMGSGNYIRAFGHDEFLHAQITGTDLTAGRLVYRSNGIPMTGGSPLTSQRLVASINGLHSIIVMPVTGRVKLQIGED